MWWVLGGAGLLLLSWGALSAHRVLYPEHRAIPPPTPLPSFITHALLAADGQSFDVWRLDTPSPRARLLLCHGYYANRFQVLDIAEGLRRRGYETLLMELRGHGGRPGPCTFGLKESEDAQRLLQWARSLDHGHPLPVGVLGLSLGAAVVCQLALREPSIRGVVVDSIYSRFFPVLQRTIWQRYHLPSVPWAWMTWWCVQARLCARLDRLDPAAIAPRLSQPLLAIQGGEDRRVVPLLGREFYQRWAGPKERWFEPTVAHVKMFARHPQEYCERVASFFDRVFAEAEREP